AAQAGGAWYAVPDFFISIPVLWRKDLFASVGMGEPKTWDDLRKAGGQLKAKGHPTGMQFSHCNDANHNWRALMYCYGVKETDPSGQNITIDSKEMREALKMGKALFDEGMTPEVFSWDDASDNRFLASGVASWIHDAISAFRTTEDSNPAVFKNTYMLPEAMGPGGRINVSDPNVFAIWKFSKHDPPPRDSPAPLWPAPSVGLGASRGYNMPFNNAFYKKPMPGLGNEPKLA